MKKGLIVMAVIVVSAMVFYGVRFASRPMNSIAAEEVTVEDSVTAKAYIVRDEAVYTAPASGTVYNNSAEGSRVATNSLLFTIYSDSVSADMLRELNVINKKIANAKQESARSDLYATNSISIESSVENKKNDILEAVEDKDIEKIYQYKSDINNMRSGTYTEENKLEVLQSQKDSIKERLSGDYKEVYSEASGVFTTILDGMEEQLTPEAVKNFSVSDFNNIGSSQSRTATTTATAGDKVCKVVNNHLWYVAAVMETEKADRCEMNKSYTLSLENIPGDTVRGKVIFRSENEDGKCFLLFECTNYLEGAFSYRTGNMSIIFDSYTGFRVPNSAVKLKDEQTGVLAERENIQSFYPCDVLYTDTEGYSVVKSIEDTKRKLENGDRIITGE